MSQSLEEKKIDEEILACVDRVLSKFGKDTRKIIYSDLRSSIGLTKEEIPRRPKEFETGLAAVFGRSAFLVERTIVTEIANHFHISLSIFSLTFTEAVSEARRARDASV